MSAINNALVDRLKADLLASMKARDAVRVATLRTMLSTLDNASAVAVDTQHVPMQGVTPDVPRRELSEAEQFDLLRDEAAARRKAIAQYEQLGKAEIGVQLRAEVAVFAKYLGDEGT